ncbi:hypothetical protein B0J13DRAFT_223766 [Dactylonectria estremocensis]|uniref:Tetraspanin n=1 Tax=Dactylonectria estremocensis TaxID=1079267 RepID=A0A9P9F7Q6_9HYPO|nr:hypothetical protein B0J13DRAFT_223766 [Dactylonectria estremocensis]
MINLAFVYLLVSVAIIAVAVFVRLHSTSLSLPISSTASILAIVLPIGALFNAYFYPRLARSASTGRLAELAPVVLQTLQALATTILATLLFADVPASQALDCKLDTKWLAMFRAHDAAGIRAIQDAFNCCGLNSVKDRAYPFPGMGASTCAETYGRTLACRAPWKSATQAMSGVDVAALTGVGLMQIIGLLVVKWGLPRWLFALRRRREQAGRESRRSLLTDGSTGDEEHGRQRENGSRSYGGVNTESRITNGRGEDLI